jgi:hypothetical protein
MPSIVRLDCKITATPPVKVFPPHIGVKLTHCACQFHQCQLLHQDKIECIFFFCVLVSSQFTNIIMFGTWSYDLHKLRSTLSVS